VEKIIKFIIGFAVIKTNDMMGKLFLFGFVKSQILIRHIFYFKKGASHKLFSKGNMNNKFTKIKYIYSIHYGQSFKVGDVERNKSDSFWVNHTKTHIFDSS
jgi:hypothetical protein